MDVKSAVNTFLKSKHIQVPDEWLTECIQWVRSENTNQNINSSQNVPEKVYEQWLYCDLTELATCCLPFGLQQKKATTITGHFALQVNQIRDVGQAAYAQLLKIQGAETANSDVSAENSYQPGWEPKPTRMLVLQLTDGTSVVQAMEYRLIPRLNANLKPGSKILISGTIQARRGILLLTQEHITILGGEIETLLIPNALENILARQLGTEENEMPREYVDTASTQVAPSQTTQYYPSQLNAASTRSQNSWPPTRGGTQASTRGRGQASIAAPSSNNFDELGDDDFLDADFEAAISQIENQALPLSAANSSSSGLSNKSSTAMSKTRSNTAGDLSTSNVIYKNSNESSRKILNLTNTINTSESNTDMEVRNMDDDIIIDDDIFSDDIDDELLLSAEGQVDKLIPNSAVSTSTKRMRQDTTKCDEKSSDLAKQSSSFSNLSTTSKNHSLTGIRQASTSCISTLTPNIKKVQPVTNKLSKLTTLQKHSKQQAKQSSLKSFLTQLPSQSSGSNSLSNSKTFQQDNQVQDDFQEEFFSDSEMTIMSDSLDMETSCAATSLSSELKLKVTPSISSHFEQPATKAPQIKYNESSLLLSKNIAQIIKQEPPFTYLILLPEKPSVTQEFVVKGFIMTLVSRLEQSAGTWKLSVMINDGTASCEADVDDHVLQELIGMSVEEMIQKKIEAKSNPVLKSQLVKNVGGCQQKLISLCSLLHLRVSADYTRPRLTAITSLTTTVAHQLTKRLSLNS